MVFLKLPTPQKFATEPVKDMPLIDFKNFTAEQLNSIQKNIRNYAVCQSLKTLAPPSTMSKSYKKLCSLNS
ncbi:hypothetical protein ID47_05130 [Candidatus Paracaedibacter acanthamoebae]|uniref:Uncharacterized protein n=1 Tax=Candidatus Odyssella acanthamoebae TaxID=91604 RepID=A0A077ASS7_9PROT|nr:hypothetical protein ID47_05130 [Candidatus Paracaedibacter acanthamoebae]